MELFNLRNYFLLQFRSILISPNSTLTHLKNLSVFTLNPKGNSQIFLLTPFSYTVENQMISLFFFNFAFRQHHTPHLFLL
jgi:hypothetical protein